jgi:pyridoxal phosphate enzyme (YggS family)
VAKRSALQDKLKAVRDRIESACAKAKRDPREVTLVAVTKYAAPEQMRELLKLGVTDLGESRVQQITQRAMQLNEHLSRCHQHGEGAGMPERIRWHMVGHLQRNKVKPVLPIVTLVHSVDSLRLAEEIETHATKMEKRQAVLLQVNAADESQKHGVAVGAAVHLAEQIDSMSSMQLMGLMTMAPLDAPESVARHTFARTREIFEEMKWNKIGGASLRHLSMVPDGNR